MSLWGAIIIGGLAAFLVPWMSQATTESFDHLVQSGSIHIWLGSSAVAWSWPAFCIVTLLAWMLLKAAE